MTDERPEHEPEHEPEHDSGHNPGAADSGTSGTSGDTAGERAIAPATLVAAVIVDELVRAGVREAVVCPGSRSAALALALAEADRTHRLRLHVRTDERSASFLALGLARRGNRPVPVVMTSGTAVANCLPAMVEATASGVPLLVLSADRPVSYQGTGANQTIAQAGIFGAHAVEAVGLTTALHDRPDHREIRTVVDRVVAASLDLFGGGVRAGGVQLNVHFVEPLVPGTTADVSLAARIAAEQMRDGESCREAAGTTGVTDTGAPWRAAARPVTALPRGAAPTRAVLPQSPVVTVDLSLRTLAIIGDVRDRTWAAQILDTLADVPTIAEPTAPAPVTPVHPAAAGLFSGTVSGDTATAELRPEQIVLVGRPTLHRSVSRLLADPRIRVVALTDRDVVPDVAHTVREWGRAVTLTGEHPAGWPSVCEAASGVAVDVMHDLLSGADFTGLHVAAAVTDALRDGDALVLGASSAVRDASLAGLPFDGVWAVSNRGAAGIDGTVSTAVGVALAHASECPELVRAPRTVALMGDLTVLHDLNGFTIGPGEPRPDNLVVVVSNDDGGAIFETLEAGGAGLRTFDDGVDAFDRVFGTPTGVDLGALCAGHRVSHRRVTDLPGLIAALDEHAEGYTDGFLVIEAVVQRAPRAALHAALRSQTTLTAGGRRD
ncbi:2-succinyl-5-enolpyruvyl-6-hydroxy-3-cyclohexene-1-carboxylic-acid synthase [uncultured Corynebacterium sp.]|uniref:2-succinyl-5-enolpyruvyl-6-hydroxy-3- cyclohexene-1-carboxylic-acid synthase n=1 Tax=uncultured Corynebacterium sp. TaxID=159447 RepID=UPI0025F0E948|nr:2-succinyl-5-enolpyruvyl-6-hydroxy-3-cyclohexene-1-carboxylic-acid synthase [uncultured Corynebacterium sp.]